MKEIGIKRGVLRNVWSLLVRIVGKNVDRDAHLLDILRTHVLNQGPLNFLEELVAYCRVIQVSEFGEDDPDDGILFVPAGGVCLPPGCIRGVNHPLQYICLAPRLCGVLGVEKEQKKLLARTLRSFSFEAEHPEKEVLRQDPLHQIRWIKRRLGVRMDRLPLPR